jgi:hypothetical protein
MKLDKETEQVIRKAFDDVPRYFNVIQEAIDDGEEPASVMIAMVTAVLAAHFLFSKPAEALSWFRVMVNLLFETVEEKSGELTAVMNAMRGNVTVVDTSKEQH